MKSTTWAQFCDFPFSDDPQLKLLASAWEFSARQLARLRRSLELCRTDIACIAVSGSLNRMEGHAGSDLDVLVVIDDRDRDYSEFHRQTIYDSVWAELRNVPELQALKPPRAGGVFSVCASWKAMTDRATRGIVDADLITFGQRMQLLLDAQPIAGDAIFGELQSDLLHWYSESRVSRMFAESSELHWLWQDVQRYWRSIRSRACWLDADQPKKSLEVNLKLRSSRLVLIAGFLQAICAAEADCKGHASLAESLQCQLSLAPLQRLTAAMPDEADRQQLLRSYQAIWAHVAALPDDAIAPSSEILQQITALQQSVSRVPAQSRDWLF